MTENGYLKKHGLLGDKELNWDEDNVDVNNDLTFGDGAIQDDWLKNHNKVPHFFL